MNRVLSFILLALLCFSVSGCGKKEGKPVFPDFNPYGVTRIKIRQYDDNNIEIFKGGDNNWFVKSADMLLFAEYKKIKSFLQLIASLKYIKAPDRDNDKLKKMAHRKGSDVKIETGNGIVSFSVKKSGDDYQSSYILLEGADSCILCAPYINTAVANPVRKWLKYTVFDHDIEQILSIRIEVAGRKLLNLKARSGSSKWINSYDNKEYNFSDIAELNEVLTRMRISDCGKSVQTLLFDSPMIKIKITTKDGKNNYIEVAGKKNSSFYYARRSDREKGILLFSKAWVNKLVTVMSKLFDIDISLTR